MTYNEAEKIMNSYGFVNNSIEPTLCYKDNNIGIFATFKTNYGHLSRFIIFNSPKEMKNFLDLYVYYRKNINKENIIVTFNDYEILSPKVAFYFNNIKLEKNNLRDLEILNNPVEELVVDTTNDDNIKLLEILKDKINDFILQIKTTENSLVELINNYREKIANLPEDLKDLVKLIDCNVNYFDDNEKLNNINEIMTNITTDNVINKYQEMLKIYEDILNDESYLDNVYLIEILKNKINNIEILENKLNDFIEESNKKNKKSKLFKKKINFTDYLGNDFGQENLINKENIAYDLKAQNSNLIIQWQNNSFEDLKNIYGITKKSNNISSKINKTNINDLESYFNNLSKKARNESLIISSPLKELINIIINFDSSKDIYNTMMKEEYYKNKFNEMYIILSNKDNYALARKYLKLIKLDTLEEFVNSLIDFVNNLNIETFSLNYEDILKYKMGIILKKGFINASLKNQFPVNNRGDNNYYISNLKTDIKVYYSPYIIKFDDNGILQANKNEDIITFNIDGLRIVEKSKVKVNNFMLKRFKNGNDYNFDFVLFNEKIYLETFIEKRL